MLCAHYFLIKGKELFGRPNSKPAITLNHGWICYHREWEIFFLPLNHYALDTLLANILRRLISLWTVLLVTVNNTIQWKNRDCITGYYAMIVILDDVRRLRCVCPDFQKKSILVGNIVVWYRTQSPFFTIHLDLPLFIFVSTFRETVFLRNSQSYRNSQTTSYFDSLNFILSRNKQISKFSINCVANYFCLLPITIIIYSLLLPFDRHLIINYL